MFQFSLQTALDVRERQEKIRMKDFADKLAIEQRIQDQIDGIQKRMAEVEQNMNSSKVRGDVRVDQFRFLTSFKDKAKLDLAEKNQQLRLAKAETKIKQEILIEASRARKMLEILKEKEMKRLREKIARRELKFMDEIAGNHFVRKGKQDS